ncbi:hypothetical protein GGR51DRAFT_26443 [Nemania sp. FL0031]|nr:hypothetical protein GGR51DRAFT_26443 [Nemania sp. FL0031]
MQSITSSAPSLPYLVNINKRHIRQLGNRRHWQLILTGGPVHYYTIQTGPRRPHSRVINSAVNYGEGPILAHSTYMMPKGARPSSSGPKAPMKGKTPSEPRPSSSIILLSPTNQVLLLHRVKTSTSFASAHVFPGGNLSEFHDGAVPPPGDANRHVDSLAYRLGAIRETFEESGILLAREGGKDGPLLNLPTSERDKARKAIYENSISFGKWLESVGGIADTDGLLPFTRWLTPPNLPKRFTTQMYVYMLPLETSSDPVLSAAQHAALIPTPDNGAEITTAHFDDAATWLEKQGRGEVMLFPPQYFLLSLISQFLTGAPPPSSSSSLTPSSTMEHYRVQRDRLRAFLDAVPTATHPKAVDHPTSQIAWADKVISPVTLGLRHSDQRAILALDKPGAELRDSGRGGDWERVVLVRFTKAGATNVEVRGREEVLAEEREAKAKQEAASPKL